MEKERIRTKERPTARASVSTVTRTNWRVNDQRENTRHQKMTARATRVGNMDTLHETSPKSRWCSSCYHVWMSHPILHISFACPQTSHSTASKLRQGPRSVNYTQMGPAGYHVLQLGRDVAGSREEVPTFKSTMTSISRVRFKWATLWRPSCPLLSWWTRASKLSFRVQGESWIRGETLQLNKDDNTCRIPKRLLMSQSPSVTPLPTAAKPDPHPTSLAPVGGPARKDDTDKHVFIDLPHASWCTKCVWARSAFYACASFHWWSVWSCVYRETKWTTRLKVIIQTGLKKPKVMEVIIQGVLCWIREEL